MSDETKRVIEGSRWIVARSQGVKDAYVWTVRGVTSHGVYFTRPDVYGYWKPGHLLSEADFLRDYVPAPRAA